MVSTLAFLALQAAIDPAQDPALARPVTIHLALRPLREVARTLAKSTGQTIGVVATVADLKATVLVKNLPAGQTMEALADTLGLVWRKEAEGYRLSRTPEATKAEAAYLIEEREARRTALKPSLDAATAAVEAVAADAARSGPGARNPGRRSRSASVRFDPNILSIEGTTTIPSRLDPPSVSGSSAFAQANAAWPSIPKTLAPAWNEALKPLAMPKSTWENDTYTLADLLVNWHDATGLPVVADAFRIPMKATAPPPGWALSSLQSMANAEGVALRIQDGVARLRHPAYWRLREQEVPEDQWSVLESGGKPSIGDYAAFASRLTVPQAAAFRSLQAPVAHVTTEALRQAYPALRLWSTLPQAVQNALLAGRAVPLASLGGTDAYAFAANEAPYYHAGDPASALAGNAARLGLFARPSPQEIALRLGPERGGGVEYLISLP